MRLVFVALILVGCNPKEPVELGGSCSSPGKDACAVGKLALCSAGTWQETLACTGQSGCRRKAIGHGMTAPLCDQGVGRIGNVCSASMQLACSEDWRTQLVCRGGRWRAQKSCPACTPRRRRRASPSWRPRARIGRAMRRASAPSPADLDSLEKSGARLWAIVGGCPCGSHKTTDRAAFGVCRGSGRWEVWSRSNVRGEGQVVMVRGLVFGCVAPSARACMARLVAEVSREVGVDVTMFAANSYEELGRTVQEGYVDIAWLPPIAYVALDRQRLVTPLVSSARGGGLSFESVIIVNKRSNFLFLRELGGLRAAWVDPYSASGYMFPRVELAAAGVDVSSFASETFYDSHEDVVRAVAMGHADFGGTYATLGPRGEVVRSAFHEMPEARRTVRVLASLGSLPADVIAVRYDVPAALQTRLSRAFVAVSRAPRNRALVLDAFGADELRPVKPRGYDVLRAETERAAAEGLL